MTGWKKCRLGDHIHINLRSIDKDYPYTEIQYLDTGSITRGVVDSYQHISIDEAPSRAKRIIQDKDIIISTVRPIQRHYGYIKKPLPNTIVSTGFAVITCEQSIDPYYLYSYITQDDITEYLDVIAEASTSTYPSFTPDILENLDILLPPLPEQKAIAGVLSSLDDKIDLLQRQNKTLEAMAETIFREMFIEKADPGWKKKGLDEIANFKNGLPCKYYPPYNNDKSLPVIKIKELRVGITDESDRVTSQIPPDYIINNGDVLFSWSGSLEVAIWSFGKAVLNQHLFKVSSDVYPKWFYYYWINHHLNDLREIAEDKATTMGHIQRHHLSEAIVYIPDKITLAKANKQINPIFDKFINNHISIQKIIVYRDILLPKLMNGDIRIIKINY